MTSDDRVAKDGEVREAQPRSRLFTVRLWTEEAAGGREYRGTVQDVVSRAFRTFRNWSDLTAFMIRRMENDDGTHTGCAKGETRWPR
jgi:hypothetical protein